MSAISESELERICDGILADRDSIIEHNPIGSDDEILLWMLLSCLISYLSLTDLDTPCFTGRPDAATYRSAIDFVLNERRVGAFNANRYIERLINNDN